MKVLHCATRAGTRQRSGTNNVEETDHLLVCVTQQVSLRVTWTARFASAVPRRWLRELQCTQAGSEAI